MTTTTSKQPPHQGLTDDFSRTRPESGSIQLTSTQQRVHDQLLSFITGKGKHPAAVFKGYAGVGKTTTTTVLVETIKRLFPQYKIGIAAPTHKAVKVLRKTPISGVVYATIYSLLALKETVNEATGEVTYTEDTYAMRDKQEPPIAKLNVLLHDETSQLKAYIWKRLVPYINNGLKVVFIGDPVQIPPVKEIDAAPFLYGEKWGMLITELTEVIRQKADNPILEFATEIRDNYKDERYRFHPEPKVNARGEGILKIRRGSPAEDELLKEYFDNEKFYKDPDYMKVVAWHRKVVASYNNKIRQLIYKTEDLDAIMVGEKLVMRKPYIVNDRPLLTTNEEVEVVQRRLGQHTISVKDEFDQIEAHKFQTYAVELKYYDFFNDSYKSEYLNILHENELPRWDHLIHRLEQRALNAAKDKRGKMWRQKFSAVEQFAWVDYNYAITAHKSQGSTYDHALVLKWDIDLNPNVEERNRILYVACSRSRHTLFIEE